MKTKSAIALERKLINVQDVKRAREWKGSAFKEEFSTWRKKKRVVITRDEQIAREYRSRCPDVERAW